MYKSIGGQTTSFVHFVQADYFIHIYKRMREMNVCLFLEKKHYTCIGSIKEN